MVMFCVRRPARAAGCRAPRAGLEDAAARSGLRVPKAGRRRGLARRIAALLVLVAGLPTASSVQAVGAQGLDGHADAAAAACRLLAETWQDGDRVPSKVEIAGRTRPVVDLSQRGIAVGADIREPLQAVFDGAKTLPAPVLFLPPTEQDSPYLRSGRVILAAPQVDVCGYGARIVATNALDLGLGLAADGIGLYGLTLEAPATAFTEWTEIWLAEAGRFVPQKFPAGDADSYRAWSSQIVVHGGRDLIVRDVTLLGAGRAGIILHGASNALIDGACVFRPRSDGIHVVHGSENVTVRGNRVVESGDDCISVVTYDRNKHPRTVRNVLIEGNLCHGSRTRGLTVIGGDDVTISGNEVRDTLSAGILLYPSPTYNTHSVRDVTVEGNRLDGAGLRRDGCNNCGDIVVNDPGQGRVKNVRIGENAVWPRPKGSPVRPGLACGG
jgi:hypothetical protein